jgi:gamma-glutamyltranspeptidase / glutathione hydrolase
LRHLMSMALFYEGVRCVKCWQNPLVGWQRCAIAGIADYGFTIQEALEAGRFTKGTFQGCDVSIEQLVPETVRRELTVLGHQLNVAQPRSGTFGWGQAVMSDPAGVHYGASEPRHDGAAIPQFPSVFSPGR